MIDDNEDIGGLPWVRRLELNFLDLDINISETKKIFKSLLMVRLETQKRTSLIWRKILDWDAREIERLD